MKNRVLIVGESSSDNIGDRAISASIQQAMIARNFEVDVKDFSCRKMPLSMTKISIFKKIFNKFAPDMLKGFIWFIKNFNDIRKDSLIQHHIVIIGGGQLIHSNANFAFALLAWAFLNKHKNIYILGCGSDSVFRNYEKFLFKLSLSYVNEVYLRDKKSIDNLYNIFSIRAKFCPDIAYLLEPEQEPNNKNKLKSNNNFGLSIIDYNVYSKYAKSVGNPTLTKSEYLDYWSKEIPKISKNYYSIYLISTTMSDFYMSEEVKKIIIKNGFSKKIFSKHISSVDELFYNLKKINTYFSGRMHGLILASLLNINLLPFEVSLKLKEFAITTNRESLGIKRQSINNVIDKICDNI